MNSESGAAKKPWVPWLLGSAAFLVVLPTLMRIPGLQYRWWLFAGLVPLVLAGCHRAEGRDAPTLRALLIGGLAAVAIAFAIPLFRIVQANIAAPPEFDIQQFWLHARVAAQGLNVYEPEHSRNLARSLHSSDAMLAEFYFWYPPPALFLFIPLGWLSLTAAAGLWYAIQLSALLADGWLLWRLFLRREGALGAALVAAFIAMLPATFGTFGFGQLNPLTLLFLLLFWRDREAPRAGVWLVLAAITKPYAAFVGLFLLIHRRWKAVGWAGATTVGAALLTIVVFGPRMFFSYFHSNPMTLHLENATIPGAVSLAGAFHRLQGGRLTNAQVLRSPLVLGVEVLLTAVTAWRAWAAGKLRSDWALAGMIPLALLLYPITGAHYGLVLLLPLFFLWSCRNDMPGGAPLAIGVITAVYVLPDLQKEAAPMGAFALFWAALLVPTLRRPESAPAPAAVPA